MHGSHNLLCLVQTQIMSLDLDTSGYWTLLARENLFFLMNISKDMGFISMMVFMEAEQ